MASKDAVSAGGRRSSGHETSATRRPGLRPLWGGASLEKTLGAQVQTAASRRYLHSGLLLPCASAGHRDRRADPRGPIGTGRRETEPARETRDSVPATDEYRGGEKPRNRPAQDPRRGLRAVRAESPLPRERGRGRGMRTRAAEPSPPGPLSACAERGNWVRPFCLREGWERACLNGGVDSRLDGRYAIRTGCRGREKPGNRSAQDPRRGLRGVRAESPLPRERGRGRGMRTRAAEPSPPGPLSACAERGKGDFGSFACARVGSVLVRRAGMILASMSVTRFEPDAEIERNPETALHKIRVAVSRAVRAESPLPRERGRGWGMRTRAALTR
jgi:hypothetical protein